MIISPNSNNKLISHQTLRRLTYFAAIADAGSIRGAAARLNLSVPVLSEALSDLEEELGVSLATRTTRRFELTEAGLRTQRAARQILDTAQGLTELVGESQPLEGRLGITVPVELAGFWLPERIKAFTDQHPEVVFDIDVTDRMVDLRAGPVEVSLRADYVAPGEQDGSNQDLQLVVVAKRSVAVSPDGAVDIPLIDSRIDRKLSAASVQDGSSLNLTFSRNHRVTNRAAAVALVRAGVGAAMVMRGSVAHDLAKGNLIQLLPGHDFGSIHVHAHFRDRLPGRVAQVFVGSLALGAD